MGGDLERPKETAAGFYAIYPAGMWGGMIVTPEMIEKAMAAEERFRNRNDKPPKPPRRPNIPIGHVALNFK